MWATGPVHALSPLEPERGGWAFGETLPAEPQDPLGLHCFVFDAHDRLVVARAYSEARASRFTECLIDYPSDDTGHAFFFDQWASEDNPPIGAAELTLHQHKPTTIRTLGRSDVTVETFRWGEAGPIEIIRAPEDAPPERYRVGYAGDAVDIIEIEQPDGSRRPVYLAHPPDLGDSLTALRSALAAAIRDSIERGEGGHVGERIYCAVLPHNPASRQSAVPEELLLARAAQRPRGDPPDLEACYAPYAIEDRSIAVSIDNPTLRELRSRIALALDTPSAYDQLRRTLIAVAADLNRSGPPKNLDATADFMFLPINVDGSDLADNLAQLRAAQP